MVYITSMNKKLLTILIIILVAIGIYGGYRVVKHYKRVQQQATQPTQTTKTTTAGSTAPGHVKLFFVAVGDAGKTGTQIGCGDSLVPVSVEVPSTEKNIQGALTRLLAIKDKDYGQSGLYNALYQSSLKLDSVTKDANGVQVVKISGTMTLGGECDNPRFLEQIKNTVVQFKSGVNAQIWINDKLLQDAVSLK
jgi:hypothetical protein